ncbi:hypothetical protein JTB14_015221 [Gonioctena quinquepunctata]|nr:hypothetical protein JTB14_015221 [Gonioctena quinquepunctata]
MECDIVHSAISTRSARRNGGKPYQVKNLSREDTQDNKLCMEQNLTNRTKDENSADVYWQTMYWMKSFRTESSIHIPNSDPNFKVSGFGFLVYYESWSSGRTV